MLSALADPIAPIFAVMVLGYLLARARAMDVPQAIAINRFVFYLAAPALVFSVISAAPATGINWHVVGLYLACEVAVYGLVFAVARFGFHRAMGESILIGMAGGFANHVFFVLPIAKQLYGPDAALPVSGILIGDALVFCSTVFLVELFGTGHAAPRRAAASLIRNPFVYAPLLGVLAWLFPHFVPSGIQTFARFSGAAAAPASLFALGVVLSAAPINRFGGLLWFLVIAKLFLHPALVYLGLQSLDIQGLDGFIPLLVAAGPCGAMPFVIATQYNVRTETIAKAVLVSTTLSVVTLALMSSLSAL